MHVIFQIFSDNTQKGGWMQKKCEAKITSVIAGKFVTCFLCLIVVITLFSYLYALPWPDDSGYINIKINNDTTIELQNEEQIVMNPRDSTNLVAVWRDFRLGYRQVGYGCSFDGGLTWNQGLFVDPYYAYDSDPGLTVDTAGNFYAHILGYTGSVNDPNGLFVFKSTDGGMTWGDAVIVVNGVPGVLEDKGLIACDRSDGQHNGNLYVSWTRGGATQDIVMARSIDGGNSFEAPVSVSDVPNAQWSVPCVGSNSEVYVAWYQYSQNDIRLDRSTDGGQTFGGDIIIQQLYFGDSLINGGISVFAFPAMDVDITDGPYDGYIYVAYLEFSPGFTDTDIYFTRSTDNGSTWTQKIRINDDPLNNGCDQFHPWLIVAPDGSIIVVFLDRRLDPNNMLMDCYMTTSTDGGATWSPNERISTVSCDPTAGSKLESHVQSPDSPIIFANRAGLLGEYIGVTASSIDDIHPIWTDTRLGNQDVFVGVADTVGTYIGENITPGICTLNISLAPNPGHDRVVIRINILSPKRLSSESTLRMYNLTGRLVKEFTEPSSILDQSCYYIWNCRDESGRKSPSGVYFLRLEGVDYSATEKLLLIR